MKLQATLAALTLLLASIAPGGSVHAAGQKIGGCTGRGMITFMFWGDQGEKIEQDADVRLAEKDCPGLHVKEIWDQGNYDNDLAEKVRQGEAPDVFQIDAEKYLPQYVSEGALTNLDPYIKRDRLDLSKIYWPTCLPETMYRGHAWGLMRDCGNQGILFYNKDMFDARHVPYPTSRWTYQDFLRAAVQLSGDYALPSDPISRLRFGYAWNDDDFRLNQYMWDWGGDWLSPNLKQCTLRSKRVQQAFAWWRNLRYKYHAAPTAVQAAGAGDYVGGFRGQSYAMTFAGPWALDYMLKPSPYIGRPAAPFRWGAVLTPRGPKSRQALMDAALEVISSGSRNKNAAWWLTRFLTEGKGGALEGAFGIGIPGSVKLARQPMVVKEYGSLLNVVFQAARYGRVMRVVPEYATFWNTLNRDLAPMWQDRESVAAATSTACADVTPLLPR